MANIVSYDFTSGQDRTGSWSMSFYNDAPNIAGSEAQALDLANKLYSLTGNQTRLNSYTISRDDSSRRTKTFGYTFFQTLTPAADWDTDYANTAVYIRLSTIDDESVGMHIRGIPEGIIKSGGKFQPFPQWVTFFNAFKGVLTGGALTNLWRINVRDRNMQKFPVTAITAAGVVSCPGHDFTDGDIVQIYRCMLPKSINGQYRVTSASVDAFSLENFEDPLIPVQPGLDCVAQKVAFILRPISDVQAVRAGHRPVGSSKNVFVGHS